MKEKLRTYIGVAIDTTINTKGVTEKNKHEIHADSIFNKAADKESKRVLKLVKRLFKVLKIKHKVSFDGYDEILKGEK